MVPAAVNSNGENGNTLKVKNGENPGMTTTTNQNQKETLIGEQRKKC